jgi:hypothetical protein
MAKAKSSTKTAAFRGGTQPGGVVVPLAKTEAYAALFHKHDTCHLIADDLHSLIMCMIVLADANFDFEGEERGLALSYIEWEIVLKSRELQGAFK